MTTRFTGTSIRNRIAITVLATVVVVSMISTAFSGRDHAARLMNDLEAETQVLTSVFGDTLSDPLWDFDYALVQQRLERPLAPGAIAGARSVDAAGQPVAAALAPGLPPAPAP